VAAGISASVIDEKNLFTKKYLQNSMMATTADKMTASHSSMQ